MPATRSATLRRRRARLLAGLAVLGACAVLSWRLHDMARSRKKTLVVGIPAYWGTTVPPLQNSVYGAAVLDNQFECLVRRGRNGVIEPLGASSWKVSPDRRVVRFKIDTSRRFSDGSALTAADFKRSWEDGLRMKARSKNRSVEDILYDVKGFRDLETSGTIAGIRAVGPDQLEIEFERPVRMGVEYLSGVRYAAYKMQDGRAIGTGPYVLEEKAKKLFFAPNPYYVGKEKRFDAMEMTITPPEAMAANLRSGEIDAAVFAEKAGLADCADDTGPIRCVYSQESEHVGIDVNGLRGRLFSNRRHRLALQALVHDSFEKAGLPAELRGGFFTRDPQSFLTFQPGRLTDAEAQRVVASGRRYIPALIEASRKTPVYIVSGRPCGWLLDLLRGAGLNLSEKSGRIDFARILEMSYKTSEPDLIYGGFSVYNGDPDGLYHVLGRHGAIFSPMVDRPGIADLLGMGRAITARAKLAPHYRKVAKAILEEVPYVHLGFAGKGVAYNPDKTTVSETFVSRGNHRVTLFEPR